MKKVRCPPDYNLKSKLLKFNAPYYVQKLNKLYWRLEFTNISVEDIVRVKFLRKHYLKLLRKCRLNSYEYNELFKINSASLNRARRLRERIKFMLENYDCIFLTMTFDSLESTFEYRKRYITRFLKNNCFMYVANVDYGFHYNREHYHAVVVAYNNYIDPNSYKLGNIDFERVRSTSDYSSLARYLNKLVNHAIKETTKNCRIIYSRGWK